jgi:SAM-dependent methyltransferase
MTEALTPFNLDNYARQEFKTPGEVATLELVSRVCGLGPQSLVLEVASGTGEAACILAERHGCRVLGLDVHRSSLRYATAKARHRRLRSLVAFAWADGRRLPASSRRFDLALCLGSPAIVGLPEAWCEMRRVVRPGSLLVMSDAVLAQRAPATVRAHWPQWAENSLPFRAYREGLEKEGLTVELAEILPTSAWDKYHAPMLSLIDEVRRYRIGDPAALEWADRNEAGIRTEQAMLPYIAYAHFMARRSK